MRHYLVSGGLGFIGSQLTSELLRDHESHVVVVDTLINNIIGSEETICDISRGKPGKIDVHVMPIAEFRPDVQFERIYHLASVVGPAAVLKYAGRITESIVRDTYSVLRIAQAQDATLINVSTSEVYGGGEHGCCAEDTACVFKGTSSARQEYAAAKLACEVAINNFCAGGKLKAVTVRPFNVAGIRQLGIGGFVLPRFVGQAILNRPLTVFGDGSQVRAFTDVRDVVSALIVAGDKGTCGTIYNAGNPKNRVSIQQLAEAVVKVTRSSSRIQFVDPRQLFGAAYQEAADKYPDSGRLLGLGWNPRYSLEETVESVYDWLSPLSESLLLRITGLSQG